MKDRSRRTLLFDLLMVLVLLAGAYFRFVGIRWGEQQYLHPDERFLVWVGTDISPVKSLGEYWNSAESSLNPNNRGHGFYVYGTLPLFLARYIVEWIYGHSGFAEMLTVGRPLSALSDLIIVLLVYLIGSRLWDRRVGLLGAAFSALAVMQIQQSHFYTVDNFINLFTWLAIYFAVRIASEKVVRPSAGVDEPAGNPPPDTETPTPVAQRSRFSWLYSPFLWLSIGFGFSLGCAMASKLSAYPAALLLPAAFLLYLIKLPKEQRERRLLEFFTYLVIGGAVSILTFRVFQPYAFSGPGFFGVQPNPVWVANIRELRNQAAGDVDFPPALQWARRPLTFSGTNLILWGLGLPLGLLAWAGVLWAGWNLWFGSSTRRLRRLDLPGSPDEDRWPGRVLLWCWTFLYFAWQSLAFNPTMRYQLPVYPGLAIFAAWAIVALYDLRRAPSRLRGAVGEADSPPSSPPHVDEPALSLSKAKGASAAFPRLLAITIGASVLLLTLGWAWAFTRIYVRPVTRIQAARWIYQNIPGPVNLHIIGSSESDSPDGVYNQPLPVPYDLTITPERGYFTSFTSNAAGEIQEIFLPHIVDQQLTAGLEGLTGSIYEGGAVDLKSRPLENDPSNTQEPSPPLPLAQAALGADVRLMTMDGRGPGYMLGFAQPPLLVRGQAYTLLVENSPGELRLPGSLVLQFQNSAGQVVSQVVPVPPETEVGTKAVVPFTAGEDGLLTGVFFGLLSDPLAQLPEKQLTLNLTDPENRITATAKLEGDLAPAADDPRGSGYNLTLDRPISLLKGHIYDLSIEMTSGDGAVVLRGSANANETSWDDGLPLRIDGYDGYGGIYRGDLVFEMYWDDNPTKLDRFLSILDAADFLLITSSRQWGSVPRVPERYPLSREYYRHLIGCPSDRTVEWCYTVADVGDFGGDLGFELVKVFDSSPNLGPLKINDQFAEEAFTVYDHPKVFIFKKTAGYDARQVAEILKAVDLTHVIHITPKKADRHPGTLLQLPSDRLAELRQAGTWASLFSPQALVNRSQPVAVIAWYLSVLALGLIVYPLLRLALPGLADHGYPLARSAGLLLLSYVVWMAGSLAPGPLPATRLTIGLIILFLALVGLFFGFRQRKSLQREWRSRSRYFLAVEGLFLAFFLFDLLIRLGNPDLWHPAHGGEKPMDFAYLNAVLKSVSFPPYDPWYAGGYLNYYYYGFVLVGVLVKWLGINPAVAYNLIIPTVFSLIAMSAFSIVYNLVSARRSHVEREAGPVHGPPSPVRNTPFLVGLAAALGMAVFGNLGVVRMLFRGFATLAAPGGVLEGAGLLTRLVWSFRGFVAFLGGVRLPYGIGDWYWIPSRAIPAPGDVEPITEFPFFTVLYGDPHAHLFALPLALLALGLAVGVLLSRARWSSYSQADASEGAVANLEIPLEARAPARIRVTAGGGAAVYPLGNGQGDGDSRKDEPRLTQSDVSGRGSGESSFEQEPPGPKLSTLNRLAGPVLWFFLAALSVGSLYPTNAWDYYPYLAITAIALGYAVWFRVSDSNLKEASQQHLIRPGSKLQSISSSLKPFLLAMGAVLLLVILSRLLWLPFFNWFGLGYNKLRLWDGTHTPTGSYLLHWGLFLFVIVSWMVWESLDWMAKTPASALRKLAPYTWLIYYALALLLGIIAFLTFGSILNIPALNGLNVHIAWLAVPLAVWAGVLILRPGQPDSKRFVLFLIGTGLVETLFVELVVLVGDIGRMNTVFKFYLQVWTLFAISAGAALGWLLEAIPSWNLRWRRAWGVVLGLLVFSAALYPLVAGRAKIENRMTREAPHTLDGMAYMGYARYAEEFGEMDLSQDERAIRWMQENVQGSPVIVEANTRNLYRWGSRFSIYTGLPGVVGWEWHQQQQRALYPPDWVTQRIFEIENFYRTTDLDKAADFLRKYDVRYIILGQQERGQYAGPGLEKFPAANTILWNEVYRDGDTVIYEVIPNNG